jgi:hypothetical protein
VLNIFKIHIFSGVVNAEDELWKINEKDWMIFPLWIIEK